MTTETELKRLEQLIAHVHDYASRAAKIIEADPNLMRIVEDETKGSFLSIGCDCCEAEAAVDRYREEYKS